LANEQKSKAFSTWLNDMLAEKAVSRYTLATNVGVTSHAVFKWLRGESVPVRDNCRAIARYFNVPEEEVFQVAGWKSW
jgi:DNA-binding XRE family transcriptional regulator